MGGGAAGDQFVDAAGGGGWGPVVTSSLLGSGSDPRTTIGSVNFAEFFLTISSATSFILLAGEPSTWMMVAGLVFGGLFAARGDDRAAIAYANALRLGRGEAPLSLGGRSLRDQIADEAVAELRNEHGLPLLPKQ